MPFDFTGKKLLVTGAGRGLVRELCKALAAAGGYVYALSRTKQDLDSLAQQSDNIHPVVADLSDWQATRDVLEELETLDGVMNNAASSIPAWGSSLDVSKETIQQTLEVTMFAAINVIQVTGKKMVAAGKGGSIVNVSGIIGLKAMKHAMPYSISKAALDMVTRQFALELGPNQIRVNSVNPTYILTDKMREMLANSDQEALKAQIPLGRFCEVSECVSAIMYLLSEHSKWHDEFARWWNAVLHSSLIQNWNTVAPQ